MEEGATNEESTDGAAMESSVCAGCLNVLDEEEFIQALNQEWHMECFRCSACDASLSSWYFEKDGLLFCKDDYWTKYGESCQDCGQIITGPVMVAGDHKFHPECFCCTSCGGFIGDGESYALVERSKLYWPPFEVMEVWLEGLAMHLSVGMPLPHDLEFDIYNYTGRSPSSSESTTPEALTPSANPPSLQPIKEGCCQQSHLSRGRVEGGSSPVRSPSPVESTAL